MTEIRRQLTLFVSEKNETIEKIRAEFNPVQYNLIPAHVTLCREDEIEPIEKIIENINSIKLMAPIQIQLNCAQRFADGKGVMLPAKGENLAFQELRKSVLRLSEFPGDRQPHLTLMHPRNSTCTDEIFERINDAELPVELSFDKIHLIEQTNGGKWNVLKEFSITKKNESASFS
jgi:2'-5' RNA ligase